MGRLGVSYLEVANVAAGLQGRGMNPTVDAVRESLGTGSRSTIGPYLRQWRSHQATVSEASQLPDQLVSLVKGLYERLECEAQLKAAEAANVSSEAIDRLQQIIDQLRGQIANLEASQQALNTQLDIAVAAGSLFSFVSHYFNYASVSIIY